MRTNIKTYITKLSFVNNFNKQQIRQYYDPKYEKLLKENISNVSNKTNFVDNKKIEDFIISMVKSEINKTFDLHKTNIVNQIKEKILDELDTTKFDTTKLNTTK